MAETPVHADIAGVWYRSIVILAILAAGYPSVTPAESYAVDLHESSLSFTISNLGMSTVEGRFHEFDGELMWNGIVAELELTGSVSVVSIDTGIRLRDRHLRGSDYFDADTYPVITYRSTSARWVNGKILIRGDLRIKNVTREVVLTGMIGPPPSERSVGAPANGEVPVAVVLTLEGEIDRRPFGVVPAGAGDRLIGETVIARGDFVGRLREPDPAD